MYYWQTMSNWLNFSEYTICISLESQILLVYKQNEKGKKILQYHKF